MAKLKALLDSTSYEALESGQKEFYVLKDDAYVLDVEGVRAHPDVTALSNAFERLKQERKKFLDDLKVKDYAAVIAKLTPIPEDFDVAQYETMKARLEELEALHAADTDPAKKAKLEELTQVRVRLEAQIAKAKKDAEDAIKVKDDEIKKRDGTIERLIKDDGLTKALIDAGVQQGPFLKAAKGMLRDQVKVEYRDGEYVAVVESDVGEIDIPKFVSTWADSEEGKPFVTKPAGGGAGGSQDKTKITENPWAKEHVNVTKQGQIVKQDRQKAARMMREAGKTAEEIERVLGKQAA
jgi:hypothetical protein